MNEYPPTPAAGFGRSRPPLDGGQPGPPTVVRPQQPMGGPGPHGGARPSPPPGTRPQPAAPVGDTARQASVCPPPGALGPHDGGGAAEWGRAASGPGSGVLRQTPARAVGPLGVDVARALHQESGVQRREGRETSIKKKALAEPSSQIWGWVAQTASLKGWPTGTRIPEKIKKASKMVVQTRVKGSNLVPKKKIKTATSLKMAIFCNKFFDPNFG